MRQADKREVAARAKAESRFTEAERDSASTKAAAHTLPEANPVGPVELVHELDHLGDGEGGGAAEVEAASGRAKGADGKGA